MGNSLVGLLLHLPHPRLQLRPNVALVLLHPRLFTVQSFKLLEREWRRRKGRGSSGRCGKGSGS